jgi:6-phosphogluconolactonase (cycloisomerase 2 family)
MECVAVFAMATTRDLSAPDLKKSERRWRCSVKDVPNIATRSAFVLVLMLLPTVLFAQAAFVYTNNNEGFVANTISAYSVDGNGALTQLANSPFLTGGTGNDSNGFISSNRILACGNFLYASNGFSGDVSAFSIDSSGNLTATAGSPFAAGGTTFYGISLANVRCDFLFAANGDAAEIFAFQIGSDGALAPVAGSPFAVASQPNSLKASPDGKFLAASLTNLGSGGIAMFSVGGDGTLSDVPGSPFAISSANQTPSGVYINFDSNLLFVAELSTAVDVFNIASDGTISLAVGSPFTTPRGNVSAVLSPDDQFLFTSDLMTEASSFQVVARGALNTTAGSPFSTGLVNSSGVSINSSGTQLFVSDFSSSSLSVMSVASDGTLSLASGSPVSTGHSSGLFSLAAYPPKTSFSISANPSSVTVAAGGTAQYSVTLTPLGGTFGKSVVLNCSLPPELTFTTCRFPDASVIPGGHPATSTLSVGTMGMTARLMSSSPAIRWLAAWLPFPSLMVGIALMVSSSKRHRIFSCTSIYFPLFLLLQLAACGGGSSSTRSTSVTPPGTYTITMSGVSGSTTRTGSVTLIVN